jgi:predicted MFS family arabinose efflux permease
MPEAAAAKPPSSDEMRTDIEGSSAADIRRRYLILVAVGIFVTQFAQPNKGALGDLPLKFLLKTSLHASKTEVAGFFAIAALFWYLKPLAGIFTDGVPLFGTRRRWYLILSSATAAALWASVQFVPQTYRGLLYVVIIINAAMVVASVVTGGLLVEAGQRYNATGRITSLRFVIMSLGTFIVGPLAGWLATRPIAYTAAIGATCLAVLAATAAALLHERPVRQRDANAVRSVGRQLVTIFRARALWLTLLCYAFFYFAPGFATPLYFYQTDTLKLSQQFIGNLGLFAGATGILGALTYGMVCRRIRLRELLVVCVAINIAITLLYELYRSPMLVLGIESLNGFGGVVADLALLDLAARATPRGSEALGYGLMMSIRNVMIAGGDVIGSKMIDSYHISLFSMVYLNAGTTAIVFLLIPLLPRRLVMGRDGEPGEAPAQVDLDAGPA